MTEPQSDAMALVARLRAQCEFIAHMLGDEPTAHDLEVVREHIPACEECSILYATYYQTIGEAKGGAA
jgi:predicted anti-sigma-YlaC factor YlaD